MVSSGPSTSVSGSWSASARRSLSVRILSPMETCVERRFDERAGVAEGVGERRAVVRPGDGRARRERPQVEGVEVEFPPDGRVGGEHHLEPPVERVAVDDARADPPAEFLPPLEQRHIQPRVGEVTGGDQPRQPAPDDCDLGHSRPLARPH